MFSPQPESDTEALIEQSLRHEAEQSFLGRGHAVILCLSVAKPGKVFSLSALSTVSVTQLRALTNRMSSVSYLSNQGNHEPKWSFIKDNVLIGHKMLWKSLSSVLGITQTLTEMVDFQPCATSNQHVISRAL